MDIFRLIDENDCEGVMNYLKEGGAPDIRDIDDRHLLLIASKAGNLSIVKALIYSGANVNAVGGTGDWTALMYAARNGNFPIVEVLLESGADAGMRSASGSRAELEAESWGYFELGAYLRKAWRYRDKTTGVT